MYSLAQICHLSHETQLHLYSLFRAEKNILYMVNEMSNSKVRDDCVYISEIVMFLAPSLRASIIFEDLIFKVFVKMMVGVRQECGGKERRMTGRVFCSFDLPRSCIDVDLGRELIFSIPRKVSKI